MTETTPAVLGTAQAGTHRLTVYVDEQDDPNSPVVILLPAMGVPAGYYRPFVRQLYERGHTVVTFDSRGQGAGAPKPNRRVRFGYREHIDDLDSVVDLVDAAFPQAPRFVLGHGLGGQVALLHAATRPARIRGIALLAAGSVWFRSFRGSNAARVLVSTQLVAALSTVLGYWPGHRFGFGGRQPSGLMRDWARQARTGNYALTGTSTDFEAALRELRQPVLAVSVEGDDLAPVSAVDHLSGKARQSVRTRRHYTRAAAGTDRLGHFGWARSSETLSLWIKEWTTAHSGAEHAASDRDA